MRALLLAVSNKVVELVVLAKVRVQRGSFTKVDSWTLEAIHRRMLMQVERMRAFAEMDEPMRASAPAPVGVSNTDVVLHVSDPAWRVEASREATALQRALGHGIQVHHIGSTAIEQLEAKPIIDLAAALPAENFSEELARMRQALEAAGYRYLGVRGGYFFEKGPAPVRTHALQVHVAGSAELAELLRFRDALRDDPALRTNYARVKVALAAFFPRQRIFYVTYKFHWIAERQWREAGARDWSAWFVAHKRSQSRLAKAARFCR